MCTFPPKETKGMDVCCPSPLRPVLLGGQPNTEYEVHGPRKIVRDGQDMAPWTFAACHLHCSCSGLLLRDKGSNNV